MYALCCLLYIGVNIACFIFNSQGHHWMQGAHEWWFHFTEFWATFMFAILQIFAIMSSPRSLDVLYDRENVKFFKLVIFANFILSLVPAILVTMDLERFEALSHNLEYVGEITLAFLDFVMLRNR